MSMRGIRGILRIWRFATPTITIWEQLISIQESSTPAERLRAGI
jgi:hypothetical protein